MQPVENLIHPIKDDKPWPVVVGKNFPVTEATTEISHHQLSRVQANTAETNLLPRVRT